MTNTTTTNNNGFYNGVLSGIYITIIIWTIVTLYQIDQVVDEISVTLGQLLMSYTTIVL